MFIPDTNALNSSLSRLQNNFTAAFGVEAFDVSSSILGRDRSISDKPEASKGEALPDITAREYDTGIRLNGQSFSFDLSRVKFIDDTWLVSAANTMRPFIRGFIVLLMIFYNWNQLLSFIGAGTLSSLGSAINAHTPMVHETVVSESGNTFRFDGSGEITQSVKYSSHTSRTTFSRRR